MRNLVIIIVLFFSSFVGNAQNSQKARKLLDEVSANVSSYKNISLTFDYILDNEEENIHQEMNGNVNLQGDKYHLNFMGVERIFDTKNIYTINHEDEEVVITKGNSEDESEFTPSKMLTFYQKGYTYKWDKEKTLEGKKIQFVELTPISTNAENQSILLGIDTQSKNIYQVIYNNKNTSTKFKIRSFKTNLSFSQKEFSFDRAKYKAKDYIITQL